MSERTTTTDAPILDPRPATNTAVGLRGVTKVFGTGDAKVAALPGGALRRPAAAGGDRPGAGARAAAAGVRRADGGAGRGQRADGDGADPRGGGEAGPGGGGGDARQPGVRLRRPHRGDGGREDR